LNDEEKNQNEKIFQIKQMLESEWWKLLKKDLEEKREQIRTTIETQLLDDKDEKWIRTENIYKIQLSFIKAILDNPLKLIDTPKIEDIYWDLV
jgi:hypothetical protein